MSSDDVVHRIGILEFRMDRVCMFLSGMYLSSHLEEFKSLEQKVMELDQSLNERISEVRDEMEREIKPRVDRLETKIIEEVSVIGDKYKDCERKKELAKEVFSVNMNNNMAQIKVKNKNIEGVSQECHEGLSLIMREYGNVSLSGLFRDCKNITNLTFPSTFNTSNITNMACMFH